MDFYTLVAIAIRIILVGMLWKTGRFALAGRTRTAGNTIELANAASLLLGFFVYPFTLVLLIHLGVRIWANWKSSSQWQRRDLVLLFLTLIIFLKGPGALSLDKLFGNI